MGAFLLLCRRLFLTRSSVLLLDLLLKPDIFSTFIDRIINFLGIAFALFLTGKVYGWAAGDAVIKRTVKCKYCRKRISEKVSLRFL